MLTESIIKELENIVGQENLRTAKEDLICYSYDAQRLEGMPEAVVRPQNAQQISFIMVLANKEKISVIPRGAGTGLSGGSVPVKGGIVVELVQMDKILEINKEDLLAVLEPGVITVDLHNAVESLGLFYPPDPSSLKTSTMGGNAAENSGGLRGLKYGVTKDYVTGLEVILPTGEKINTGARTVKSVSGYDLTRLFVGSEGTLGIVTKIMVKLLPLPEDKKSLLAIFSKLEAAARAVSEIVSHGILPATLEIMDNVTIRTIEEFKHIGLPKEAGAALLIEVDGYEESTKKEAQKMLEICQREEVSQIKVAENFEERERLWEGRRAALAALARARPTTILEDATVPRSKLVDMVQKIREIANKYSLQIGTFGHAGDGNLHPTILTDERDEREMKRVEKAIEEIFQAAIAMGGTLSGEHGIGLTKAKFLELEMSKETLSLMRKIKVAADPNGILNPGKVFLRSESSA